MTELTNRDVLIRAAAKLFREKGYHGVGMTEILAACELPKGSLYYHFPGGKSELAAAATLWTGGVIEKLVDRAFHDARTFDDGVVALCQAIAALSAPDAPVPACPVASVLQASTQEPELRDAARQVLVDWTACLSGHAKRLGHPAPHEVAELVLMQLEGAWLLAIAEQSRRPFEQVAAAHRSATVQRRGKRRQSKRK